MRLLGEDELHFLPQTLAAALQDQRCRPRMRERFSEVGLDRSYEDQLQ